MKVDTEDKEQLAEWSKKFSANLVKERKKAGYTAEEMADQLKISLSHYRTLEVGGGNFPSVPVLIRMWITLRTAREKLFDGIIDWDEITELKALEEKYGEIKPDEIKRTNRVLDAMFSE